MSEKIKEDARPKRYGWAPGDYEAQAFAQAIRALLPVREGTVG